LADAPARTWPALDLDVRHGSALPADFDDRLALALDDLAPAAIEDRPGVHWRVYFETDAARDAAVAALAVAFDPLVDVTPLGVPDEGWAVKVQQDLGAVTVGRFVVAPPWGVPATPAPSADSVVLVIEPSMGFGTGHHQSTRLCLRWLQQQDVRGVRVIDAGTGSGVLAIAAARLGAREVLAVDNDPDAVTAAADNVARNGVAGVVTCRVDDLDTIEASPAPIVVANLTAFLLRRYAHRIAPLLAENGVLVTSGFTVDQVPLVLDAFPGLHLRNREDEDDWVGLVLEK
jgi:ribosomal protein L11 methyltransferase